MLKAQFVDFVKLADFFFKTLGIKFYDIGEGTHRSWQSYVIFYIAIINLSLNVFCEIIYVTKALYTGQNFIEAVMICSYIGFALVGLTKMIYIWWQRKELSLFMQQLMNLFPKTYIEQQNYTLLDYLKKCGRITVSFAVLNMVLIWTYNMSAAIQYLIADRWLGLSDVDQRLPYLMWLPWSYQDHWSYYALYVSQSFSGYSSTAGQLASDLLLFATAIQVIMQYDYVAKTIEEYEVKGSSKKEQEDDILFLSYIVDYHEKVLSLSERMNVVFGVPLLLNFMGSSFVICFLGFQMTIGVSTEVLIQLFLFLLVSLTQVFLVCHFGQKLIDSSQNIAQSVYNQNWHNAEVRYKKMLVLIAERAQKPALLRATRFMCISLGTMTVIMQVSYKFFALLRTMYSE